MDIGRFSGIGAAVIGAGFIGTVHIEALRRLGVPIHGLLLETPELGASRAAELGLPASYDSLDDLLADDRVRVVHVTSPNELHYEQATRILEAGRHVVCEKPLTLDARESGELVELARRSGLVAVVNYNIRFYPLNQHVRRLVADGGLGEVRYVTGHYHQDWLLFDTDWNWRLEPERGGALRAVGDIGSHWLDLITFLTGQHVQAVMADLTTFVKVRRQPAGPVQTFSLERATETVDREIRTEDTGSILLRFDGGARGAVTVSQVSPGLKNSLRYEIDGSTAAAAWDSERPDELWLGHRDQPNELLGRNAGLMNADGASAASLPGGHVEGFADTFKAMYRDVYSAIADGAVPEHPRFATFADGHDEMLVLDAVARSNREGRWVEVAR